MAHQIIPPARIAFDIGGVLSKYPAAFHRLALDLARQGWEVHVITDQPDRETVLTQLAANGFGFVKPERVHCADYAEHGEMCKALLIREFNIGFLVDDFAGYLVWDSSLGPSPVRLRVEPDAYRPYWHPSWICEGGDFGRRYYAPSEDPMEPQP